MTDDLRVALLGFGLAGSAFHAPLIAVTPGLRLAAVVTSRQGPPDVEVLDRPERVWERATDFDLVVVATPNRTHVPLAHAALDAGLPVVVDKPLALDAASAQGLVDAAADAGRMLTVFQNRRWDGDFRTVAQLLRTGELGRPLRFESRFERWRPTPKPGWRETAAPEEGGGVLLDLGSHLVDQALQLFGPVREVYAEIDRRRPDAAVDDDVFLALTHADGVRSHLWASAVTAQLGPRMRVLGDRAAYVKWGLDVQEDALRAGELPGRTWGEEPPEAWGLLGVDGDVRAYATEPGAWPRFYAGVVAALRDGAPPPVDPHGAVEVLRILDAARAQRA